MGQSDAYPPCQGLKKRTEKIHLHVSGVKKMILKEDHPIHVQRVVMDLLRALDGRVFLFCQPITS